MVPYGSGAPWLPGRRTDRLIAIALLAAAALGFAGLAPADAGNSVTRVAYDTAGGAICMARLMGPWIGGPLDSEACLLAATGSAAPKTGEPAGTTEDPDVRAYGKSDPVSRAAPSELCLEIGCIEETIEACASNRVCRGAVVGAATGATVELATQVADGSAGGAFLLARKGDLKGVGKGLEKMAISAVSGAVTGAASGGYTGPGPLKMGATIGAVAGGISGAEKARIDGTDPKVGAAGGMFGGALGGGAGKILGNALKAAAGPAANAEVQVAAQAVGSTGGKGVSNSISKANKALNCEPGAAEAACR